MKKETLKLLFLNELEKVEQYLTAKMECFCKNTFKPSSNRSLFNLIFSDQVLIKLK